MNSKEALKLLYSDAENYAYFNETEEDLSEIKAEYELIKQDLDRFEKLEKEYKEARKSIKSWNENGGELLRENAKLKKVIEILKDILELQLENDVVIPLTDREYDLLKEYL